MVNAIYKRLTNKHIYIKVKIHTFAIDGFSIKRTKRELGENPKQFPLL